MDNHNPLITILFPVYNGSLYLREAIDSIIAQTFTDWEMIAVDDFSSDNSVEIIRSYKDPRIICLENDKNRRTAYGLNLGIELAKGKYLARMDQDDIAISERLQIQYDFMESNTHIGICGTQIQSFGHRKLQEGVGSISAYPTEDEDIKLMNFIQPPFAHPSVMIRKSVLKEHNLKYRPDFIAEDYWLWSILLPVTQAANIDKVLLKYRIHGNSITKTLYKDIIKERRPIKEEYLKRIFKLSNKQDFSNIYSNNCFLRKKAIIDMTKWNEEMKKFEPSKLEKMLKDNSLYIWQNSKFNYYIKRLLNLVS